jgi:signal transduction histidine kinase
MVQQMIDAKMSLPVVAGILEAAGAKQGTFVEQLREAGLPIELRVDGDARELPLGIELSAYRIVQEALTNALKYARGARARVDLRYAPDALEVEVVNAGGAGRPGIEPAHDGRGLIGMRERVGLFGGQLEAGPTGDGYRVVARLPLGGNPGSALR